jgi:hypothetical protein
LSFACWFVWGENRAVLSLELTASHHQGSALLYSTLLGYLRICGLAGGKRFYWLCINEVLSF